WDHDDERPLRHGSAADRLVTQGLPREQRYWRVEPHGFFEYRPRIGEARDIVERRRTTAQYTRKFGMQTLFDLRRLRQQIPGPGKRVCRGLVAGHKDHRRLVAQCRLVERLARFPFARLEQQADHRYLPAR